MEKYSGLGPVRLDALSFSQRSIIVRETCLQWVILWWKDVPFAHRRANATSYSKHGAHLNYPDTVAKVR